MSKEKKLKATIELKDKYTKPIQNVTKKTQIFSKVASKVKAVVIKADDKASKTIEKVVGRIKKLKSIKAPRFVIKAKDSASKVISKVKGSISKIKNLKTVQLAIKAKDNATNMLSKIHGKAKGIARNVYSITIKAKDLASGVIDKIKGKAKALGMVALGGATAGATVGVKGLAEEETQKITINRVIENSGKSKKQAKKATDNYYKYLADYANKTPFTTQEISGFGTKGMMMAKGNVKSAKNYTDMMANVKAFVGDMRTSQEVAEAFFSAQNGNMESLNNILGENYSSFDKAIEGIKKKQGGLVDEMSQTSGGLWSTILGKIANGAKNVVKVFGDSLKGGMSNFIGFIDSASSSMISFAERVGSLDFSALFKSFDISYMTNAIQPVVDLFNQFFTAIETKSPTTMAIMQILGTVWNTVWSGVGAVINAVKPIIEKIFNFIGEHGSEISNIVSGLGVIWNAVWSVIGVLLEGAWVVVKPILSLLLKTLDKLSTAIQKVGDWWKNMCDKINNNPIVATVKKVFTGDDGKKSTSKKGKRSAFGTREVRGNEIPFRLHDGERVLTKGEAKRLDKNQVNGVSITIKGLTVREEADIDKVATKLVKKLNQNRILMGGV